MQETAFDAQTNRKFFLDRPAEVRPGEKLVFLLNLHGGGSHGVWQRLYFPAFELVDSHRLIVATPSSATREPIARWVREADDEHLRNIVEHVVQTFGAGSIAAFWLVGHSQGGMTSNRLLFTDFFAQRVDGWLSLSGGRIGPAEVNPEMFIPVGGVPRPSEPPPPAATDGSGGERRRPGGARPPETDLSFIFATGEHEIVRLPESSPWAEKYSAGPRVRLPDVVDEEPGRIHDTKREGRSNAGWGLLPRPGTAQVHVYPNARDGRVIADVVRLDKGHTEGLEPRITQKLVESMISAPGGKLQAL